MQRHDCEVCRGRGQITLPLYREAVAVYSHEAPALDVTSRVYPCPECSEVVTQERIAVVGEYQDIETDLVSDVARYNVAIQKALVSRLAVELLRRGLVAFEEAPAHGWRPTKRIRATIGAVSKAHVASMEERIAERQYVVAKEVISAAIAGINHWGSHYGQDWLFKGQAVDSVRGALGEVTAARAAWRKAEGVASVPATEGSHS